MARELDSTMLACPLSRPLFDFLASFVTGWPWWVLESDSTSLTIRTPLPSATHGPCAWLDVRMLVDPLGRLTAWSTWERKRTHIDHGRVTFEPYLAALVASEPSKATPSDRGAS